MEHPEIRVDGWGDGEEDEEGEREEWMEDEPEEQRVPDDSGAVLPVIEESSIFSQKTTIYGDKRSELVY